MLAFQAFHLAAYQPPAATVASDLTIDGAELARRPREGRAVALWQRVRIRAPRAAAASQVYEECVEHTASCDGSLRKVETPRARKPEAPLPLEILHHEQTWLCENALADIGRHRLVCGEHSGLRHRYGTVADSQITRGNQPPPVQLHTIEHHALQATPLEKAAFLRPLPGRRRHRAASSSAQLSWTWRMRSPNLSAVLALRQQRSAKVR